MAHKHPLPHWLCRIACAAVGAATAASLIGAGADAPAILVPRFTHPAAGQTYYFLLTDRFANGSTANDGGDRPREDPAGGFDPTRLTHWHGGDFVGLTQRLDYLQGLGVTAIWVTPPVRNQAVRERSGGRVSTGYHGYWALDFLHVDPHLGTDDEFAAFVAAAHARGIRVCMDVVVNHTADVIRYGEPPEYRDLASTPYRDAEGRPFDLRAVAFNGLGDPAAFPALSVDRSFPHRPEIPAGWEHAKNPDWLNDPTLYHNRGDPSRTVPESAIYSDFRGLDGVMTEHPRVVQGFIDVFRHWIQDLGVDAFRIDTARHVNAEFWEAFARAMRAAARERGRNDFIEFGEVVGQEGDPAYLSEFSTALPLDATLDFGFAHAARRYVSQGGSAAELAAFFARDDYYTDHDSNAHSGTTFLSNHDAGRFGFFLLQDNPGASPDLLVRLTTFAHGLLLLSRGQPVLYYGDEQGMLGRGGDHDHAREDMFPAQAEEFKSATLIGTSRTGADDKFDPAHPLYRLVARLGALRAAHRALRTGAMLVRTPSDPGIFAFSRIDRAERIEYLCAFNASRTETMSADVPTSQPAKTRLVGLIDSSSLAPSGDLTVDERGEARVTLGPLQFAVWRAERPLTKTSAKLAVELVFPNGGADQSLGTREIDGLVFPLRREIRAELARSDGFAEVTFALARASRPGQWELLGTDDAPPYRIFWRPPPDLAAGEELTFFATARDLRGGSAATQSVMFRAKEGAPAGSMRGVRVPRLRRPLPTEVALRNEAPLVLRAEVEGTAPLEYQWLCDGEEISGATSAELSLSSKAGSGSYAVIVRNIAGTIVSAAVRVRRSD